MRNAVALLVFALGLCWTVGASAQSQSRAEKKAEAEAQAQQDAKEQADAKDEAAKAPPPAIPGAAASGQAAPSDKLATDMSPNDALFDAINRGDIVGARDAMSRGAELEAHNVLGQTPLDAAIDQNRNDITFLLLSMRTASPAGRPHVQLASARMKLSSGDAAAHDRHHRHATAVSAHAPSAAPRAAQSTAMGTDRGTPNPSVGFTGF